jgi:tocopherol cyclase
MLFNQLHALWHPACYHGWGRSKRFFEGWYYKLVSVNETHAFAIIPGIAMDENGQQQAFIQVLDGKKNTAWYHRFPVEDFCPTPRKHALWIGDNFFSEKKIILDLPQLKGKVSFEDTVSWSNSLLSPGIMGPFSFVPFMECYHGILSMNHVLKGGLCFKEENISFSEGLGYTEKDWGHSFPAGYIWMQSNHFSCPGISVKASMAIIPWLGSSFIGHIAGVLFNGKLYEFTTYNGTKVKLCLITEKTVKIEMENPQYRLSLRAKRDQATSLAAPIAGFMDARIEESMKATIEVGLFDKKTNVFLLKDKGSSAGIEVAGDYARLLKK